MVSWTEFAEAEPEMAARGLEHLKIPIAYFATVRKDGSPRLHPLSPLFADGRLFVAITASAPRRHDLMRNPNYSLHTLPPDSALTTMSSSSTSPVRLVVSLTRRHGRPFPTPSRLVAGHALTMTTGCSSLTSRWY
jgi:hypothetical protein